MDPVTFNERKIAGSNGPTTFFIILIGEVDTLATPVVWGGPEDFGALVGIFIYYFTTCRDFLGICMGPPGGLLIFSYAMAGTNTKLFYS